jgi:hypothetical protein
MLELREDMVQGDWQEQWERVLIGLARVEQIYWGRAGGSAEAVYDLYSFFLNAFHLRDWLVETTSLTLQQVDGEIDTSTALQACVDFANRVKHFKLDPKRTPRDRSTDGHHAAECSGPAG